MSYEPVDFEDCDPINITLTKKQQGEHESVKNERFCVTVSPTTNQETSVKIDLGGLEELQTENDLLKDYDEYDESISESDEGIESGSSKSDNENEPKNTSHMEYVKKVFSQLNKKDDTINDLLKVLCPSDQQQHTKPKYVAIGGPKNVNINVVISQDQKTKKKDELLEKMLKMTEKFPNLGINFAAHESVEALQNKYNKMRLESIKSVKDKHIVHSSADEMITWQQFLKEPIHEKNTVNSSYNDDFVNKVQETVNKILTPEIITKLSSPSAETTENTPSDLDHLTDAEYEAEVAKDVKNVLAGLFGSFGKVIDGSGNNAVNNVNPFETFITSFQKFNTLADKYNMPVIKDIVAQVTSMAETGQLPTEEQEQEPEPESVSDPELDSDPEPDGNSYAHAEGVHNVAVGINSHAEGVHTIATGTNCPVGAQGIQGPKGCTGLPSDTGVQGCTGSPCYNSNGSP